MPASITYSPLPKNAYKLAGLRNCEVSVIDGLPHAAETWNLFWLSTPEIDHAVGRADWTRFYTPVVGALASMVADVGEDPVLRAKLRMRPDKFASWFEHEDHPALYQTYARLGGASWTRTAVRRAKEAAARLKQKPAEQYGNVIMVDFRKAA